MKDFGSLNSPTSTCSFCGSGNHRTLDHAWLNDAAPELLEALKDAQESIRKLLNSQRPELIPELDPQGWGELIVKAEGGEQ